MNKSELQDKINWYEFAPVRDYFLVQTIPNESEKKTESGIIIKTNDSIVEDRPRQGVIKSVGPDCPYEVGQFVFWQKNAGYDLHNIRLDQNDNPYLLLHPDAILGIKVKDTRNNV